MSRISICGLVALILTGCALFCSSFALSLPFWSTEEAPVTGDDYDVFTAGIWGFCTNVVTIDDDVTMANCTPYRSWIFGSPDTPYNITLADYTMAIAPFGLCKLDQNSSTFDILRDSMPLTASGFQNFYKASCGGWARFSLVINVIVIVMGVLAVGELGVLVAYWFCPPSLHTQLFISRLGLRLLIAQIIISILVLMGWAKQSPIPLTYGSAYYSALVACLLYVFAGLCLAKYHFYDIPSLNGLASPDDDTEAVPVATDVVFIELGTPVSDSQLATIDEKTATKNV
ncbi:hypothetical protein THRCLA_09525 [Thraustotheca clavata]|uniref:Transmembrane protein n=1 Tax=Thraustotheca clavata TaxID=74557 RepID=A0A1V9YW58_9STRA|nr:hypothetical protein THRCLA_09525 [Thraustotheca clavata]